MRLLRTLTGVLSASSEAVNRGGPTTESVGAYWCNECSERIPDVDVEGDSPPDCPECGDEMTFERSPESASCAC